MRGIPALYQEWVPQDPGSYDTDLIRVNQGLNQLPPELLEIALSNYTPEARALDKSADTIRSTYPLEPGGIPGGLESLAPRNFKWGDQGMNSWEEDRFYLSPGKASSVDGPSAMFASAEAPSIRGMSGKPRLSEEDLYRLREMDLHGLPSPSGPAELRMPTAEDRKLFSRGVEADPLTALDLPLWPNEMAQLAKPLMMGAVPLFKNPGLTKKLIQMIEGFVPGRQASRITNVLRDTSSIHNPQENVLKTIEDITQARSVYGPEWELASQLNRYDLQDHLDRQTGNEGKLFVGTDSTVQPKRPSWPYGGLEVRPGGRSIFSYNSSNPGELRKSTELLIAPMEGKPLSYSGADIGAGEHLSLSWEGMSPDEARSFGALAFGLEPWVYPKERGLLSGDVRHDDTFYARPFPVWMRKISETGWDRFTNPAASFHQIGESVPHKYYGTNLSKLSLPADERRVEIRQWPGSLDPNEWMNRAVLQDILKLGAISNPSLWKNFFKGSREDTLSNFLGMIASEAPDILRTRGARRKDFYSMLTKATQEPTELVPNPRYPFPPDRREQTNRDFRYDDWFRRLNPPEQSPRGSLGQEAPPRPRREQEIEDRLFANAPELSTLTDDVSPVSGNIRFSEHGEPVEDYLDTIMAQMSAQRAATPPPAPAAAPRPRHTADLFHGLTPEQQRAVAERWMYESGIAGPEGVDESDISRMVADYMNRAPDAPIPNGLGLRIRAMLDTVPVSQLESRPIPTNSPSGPPPLPPPATRRPTRPARESYMGDQGIFDLGGYLQSISPNEQRRIAGMYHGFRPDAPMRTVDIERIHETLAGWEDVRRNVGSLGLGPGHDFYEVLMDYLNRSR